MRTSRLLIAILLASAVSQETVAADPYLFVGYNSGELNGPDFGIGFRHGAFSFEGAAGFTNDKFSSSAVSPTQIQQETRDWSSYRLSIKGNVPTSGNLSLYGKASAYYVKTTISSTLTTDDGNIVTPPIVTSVGTKTKTWSPAVAIGLDYVVSPRATIYAQVEYIKYKAGVLSDDSEGETIGGIGVRFAF